MIQSWNKKLWTGFITGLISPPSAFGLFCLFNFAGDNVWDILISYTERNVLTHIISLSVIVNLPLFFIFLNSGREQNARGVLGATILYGLIIVILKLT